MGKKLTRQQMESQWRTFVRQGSQEGMQWMLDGGWDINHATRQGMTGLKDAAHVGSLSTFQFLLSHGAQPTHAEDYLWLAVQSNGRDELAHFLRAQPWHTRKAELNGLCMALMRRKEDLARAMLAKDILNADYHQPNAVDVSAQHSSALTIAAQHCPGLVPPMLAAGADPNHVASTPLRRTSFMQACASRVSLRTLARMIQAGADPNARDAFGETPLFVAARDNQLNVMTLLRKHGAELTAANHAGDTALDHAQASKVPGNSVSARDLLLQWISEDLANTIQSDTPAAGARGARGARKRL